MFQLSNAGEYAIRAMLHLAAQEDKGVSQISMIAKVWNIPENSLRKILNSLAKSGLVSSSRGMGGGFVLARPASEITLLDIVEAVEGKNCFNRCLISSDVCDRDSWCPVHVVWREVQDSFSDTLGRKTLEALASDPGFVSHFRLIADSTDMEG